MSEFRQDELTGAWVIIAPERGGRPRTDPPSGSRAACQPSFDPDCPFCPGNEHMLPGVIEETPVADPPGWRARVVPNKYPALRPATQPPPSASQGVSLPGHGYHEVIVDTPRHDAEPVSMAPEELTDVLAACRRRYVDLVAQPGIEAVLIFRNRGAHGGASQPHPHSQVIATGLVPPRVATARDWARSYCAKREQCAACALLAREARDGRRIVESTDRFTTLVPFAAAGPFEQRILPTRHQASFAETSEEELAALAASLRRALARLRAALDDPAYHYVIESGAATDAGAAHAHWSLRIVPAATRPGGFEVGSGLPINPSLPERDAEALRAAATSAG